MTSPDHALGRMDPAALRLRSPMLEHDRGSCYCGAVKFEGGFDLTRESYRCNRSICRRTRLWPAVAKPGGCRHL